MILPSIFFIIILRMLPETILFLNCNILQYEMFTFGENLVEIVDLRNQTEMTLSYLGNSCSCRSDTINLILIKSYGIKFTLNVQWAPK